MNNDPFEQRLRNQPMRDVPAEWRAQVLGAARSAAAADEDRKFSRGPTLAVAIKVRLSAILWPHPAAWAGLAAVWLGILAFTIAGRDESQSWAKASPPPSPEVISVLRSQERLLAELIGPAEASFTEADRPKPAAPRPRSERRDETWAA